MLTKIAVGVLVVLIGVLAWGAYELMQAHDEFMQQTCTYCQKGTW